LAVTSISTCKWIDPTVVDWTSFKPCLAFPGFDEKNPEEKIETLEAQKREVAEQLHKAVFVLGWMVKG